MWAEKRMDTVSSDRRSENMRRIKSQDTIPEMMVRRLLHRLGFRFRLHRRDLPGRPDLVFPGRHKIIFIHGCFWHQHAKCRDGRPPSSRTDYWLPKLERNRSRDKETVSALRERGWRVLVIWECEIHSDPRLTDRLCNFLRET